MPENDPAPSRRPEDGSPPRRVAAGPRLPDPWSRCGPLPLDGYFEREQFAPLLMGLGVLVLGFVAFQVIGALATVALLVPQFAAGGSGGAVGSAEAMMQSIGAEAIIGNSIGQAVGLGGLALLVAGWHSGRRWGFLRLRRPPWQAVVLGLVGLAALTPVLSELIRLNQQLPLPESLRFLEDMRMETIRMILESGLGPVASVVGLAVVPALCEEVLFRGYAQRQFERAAGVAGGIALAGVLFGIYHLDPLQALPLAVLGTYFAYLTWRTGSLWPAIIAHFANNAYAVVMTELGGAEAVEAASAVGGAAAWPWQARVAASAGGLILFAAVLFLLHTRAPRWRPAGG
jgi:membrane protease YdiL (CAAX protease family)